MSTKIVHKRSSVANRQPQAADLVAGELAINTNDGKIFLKKDDNTVVDTTKQIFDQDTSVVTSDTGTGTITANVDGTQKLQISADGVTVDGPITVNSKETLFFNDADNDKYVAFQAPDTVDYSYVVKLPSNQPPNPGVLSLDGKGNAEWSRTDLFGGNRIYVSDEYGNDVNDGRTLPVKTIKRAAQLAASLGHKPDVDPGVAAYNAQRLLEDNRTYIQKETIGFIERNFVDFDSYYDSAKCERDIGYIVDAASYDLALGTNYNAVYNGIAYTRANSNYLQAYQNIQTVGAITFAKGEANTALAGSVPAQTASDAAFDEVLDILQNGTTSVADPGDGVADALTFPAATTTSTDEENAKDQLQANRDFLKAEVIAYIAANYPDLTYDSVKCARDVGYIVDALCYDIMYGGNSASVRVAESYFVGAASQLGAGQATATAAAYDYLATIVGYVITENTSWTPLNSTETQDVTGTAATATEATTADGLVQIIEDVITAGDLTGLPSVTNPVVSGETLASSFTALQTAKSTIQSDTTTYITNTYNGFTYNSATCERDVGLIIDAVVYNLILGGNNKAVAAGESYLSVTEVINNQKEETLYAIAFARDLALALIQNDTLAAQYQNLIDPVAWPQATGAGAVTTVTNLFNTVYDILDTGTSPTVVEAAFYTIPITIIVSGGDFYVDNPIIIPDKVSIVGDGIRAVVIRPLNANKDMFRVRNGAYMAGITFRDGLDASDVPSYTFNWAVAFDDPTDTSVDRIGYFGISNDKPTITLSPYVQNCSIISFLGGNGVLVDGSKVVTPNTPVNSIEAENPVVGDIPEQGKSMIANAFTMISFGGTGWVVSNDGYAQIVSCFQIFCLNGSWTQSGGYLSITNSATNFGIYALRSSGYSAGSFEFDRGIVAATGTSDGIQTFTTIGTRREPISQYVIQLHDEATDANITPNFKQATSEVSFDASTDLNTSTEQFLIAGHGFSNGEKVTYDANGNTPILGLIDQATYYVQVVSTSAFLLFNDDGLQYPVDIIAAGTGTHKFFANVEEFFVENILETHDDYQTVILPAGSYTINPGDQILADTSGFESTAYVFSYDSNTQTLIISNEFSTINEQPQKILLDATSVIQSIAGNAVNISVTSATAVAANTYFTTSFRLLSTVTNNTLQSANNALGERIKLHRPSIVNSSAHTWEFAGAGTDYNALPQNGGLGRGGVYEQYSELPGRVYSSGTNELGDFKVGDFITAENKTGNILFRTQVSVGELTVLKLSLSDIEVTEFSTDTGLGDNEPGGASNARVSTQRAVRTFIANRLGNVLDKQASSNAVPGALVQLNSSGQINQDLLPPARGVTTYNVEGYGERLNLATQIPPINVISGDNASESYEETQLELTGNVTVVAGETITQATSGATGVVKESQTENVIKLIEPLTGTFDTTNELTGSTSGALGANSVPTTVSTNTIVDNYYLKTDTTSQFLVLSYGTTYDFSGVTSITGANSGAQGTIASGPVYGVAYSLDATTLDGGTGYTPAGAELTYNDVALTGGTGTGARANITVNSGSVTNVELIAGGSGYLVGDVLSAAEADIGGTVTTAFDIEVLRADTRLFVNLTGNFIKFAATATSPEYIEDANATSVSIADQAATTTFAFDGQDQSLGGDVDYTNSTFNIAAHGFTDGEAVEYDNNGNLNIGNLVNQKTYWVKVIDSDNFEIYNNYAFTSGSKVLLGSSQTGTHNFIRYAVNVNTGTFYVAAHGFATGEVIRYAATTPPDGLEDNGYYYVGSITTNSFTLHNNRTDAVASVSGTTVGAISFGTTGTGSATLNIQNVSIVDTTNTSSTVENNWGRIAQATFDASNIVSGVMSPSRLAATGSASDKTFLRGDSAWAEAVQNIRPASASSPITVAGDFYTDSSVDYYYNSLTIDVDPVEGDLGTPSYTNRGTAAFDKTYFDVADDGSGQVTIIAGSIDAGTIDGLDSAYFTDPANLVGTLGVTKGGTGLTTYTQGDLIISGSNNSLTQLNIGAANSVLTSNGTVPAWSTSLTLGGTLTVSGATSVNDTTASTSTTTGALKVAGGLGVAGAIFAGSIDGTAIGANTASTGAFTTLTASGAVTFNGTSTTVQISPTGTGTVTIAPGGTLTLGAATKSTVLAGNVSATGTQTINLSPTSTGTVTINPATAGAIDNMAIGATTRSTGAFTTLTANDVVTITDTTASTDADTGALTVDGGVGINGALNVASAASIGTGAGGDVLLVGAAGTRLKVNASGGNATLTSEGGELRLRSNNSATGGITINTDGTTTFNDAIDGTTATFTGNVEHTGLTMTSGTDIDQLTTTTVNLTLSQTWQDTGINGADLATGSYYVQVYANDVGVGGGHTDVYYSGVMSWYASTTSETTYDEIVLNRAGSSVGNGALYVRLLRTSSNPDNLKLQLAGNTINTGAADYVFKFRRII